MCVVIVLSLTRVCDANPSRLCGAKSRAYSSNSALRAPTPARTSAKVLRKGDSPKRITSGARKSLITWRADRLLVYAPSRGSSPPRSLPRERLDRAVGRSTISLRATRGHARPSLRSAGSRRLHARPSDPSIAPLPAGGRLARHGCASRAKRVRAARRAQTCSRTLRVSEFGRRSPAPRALLS
jgi:hypothetical protein